LDNLVKKALELGGTLVPLIINSKHTGGTGLCNPSIYVDGDDLLVNIRNVNYILYHSEGDKRFESRWGPLTYMHPENDSTLRTKNFVCKLDAKYNIKSYARVNTAKYDTKPTWTFIGLEDGRLVRWNNKLYLSGVRRDTKPNGEGRIELSEIECKFDPECETCSAATEISRTRIEPPSDPDSYCEKNWMPILDMPYHYVKWVNKTEVVKVDPTTKTSKTVHLSDKYIDVPRDLRGSSQVLSIGEYKMCITHEVYHGKNEAGLKNGTYYHRFVFWDKDWNIVKITNPFSFMTAKIEFCCGAAIYNNKLVISFGFQDNAAYLVDVPISKLEELINAI
jgi:hypothetical protein